MTWVARFLCWPFSLFSKPCPHCLIEIVQTSDPARGPFTRIFLIELVAMSLKQCYQNRVIHFLCVTYVRMQLSQTLLFLTVMPVDSMQSPFWES